MLQTYLYGSEKNIQWCHYCFLYKTEQKLLLLLLSHFSHVWLCATPQTAHQAPPSLGFSRQENWSGLPFPSPCGKLLKRWEYQTTWFAPEKSVCMQVKKLELDMEQQTWFQIRKGVRQGCVLSPSLFNLYAQYIMRNARLDETQAGIKIVRRNINNLNMQMTPPLWQTVKRN